MPLAKHSNKITQSYLVVMNQLYLLSQQDKHMVHSWPLIAEWMFLQCLICQLQRSAKAKILFNFVSVDFQHFIRKQLTKMELKILSRS